MMRRQFCTLLLVVCVGIILFFYFKNAENMLQTEYIGGEREVSDVDGDLSIGEEALDVDNVSNILTTNSGVGAVIEQIKNGYFYNVEFGDYDRDSCISELERLYKGQLEWAECYLNESGLKGLVWQGKKGIRGEQMKRIEVIFAVSSDQVVYLPITGLVKFSFLGKNEYIIRHYYNYGVDDHDIYTPYIFDNELNEISVYSLQVISIEDWAENQIREELLSAWDDETERGYILRDWGCSEVESVDELIEKSPQRVLSGVYYSRYTGEDKDRFEEILTEQQFMDVFEEMAGMPFYEVRPDWYERQFG